MDDKSWHFSNQWHLSVKFYLPEFSAQECVKWNFQVDNSKHMTKSQSCYDVILGRDLLEQLPSDVKFSDRTMSWQEATIPVKKADELDDQNVNEIVEQCHETGHLHEVTRRTMETLADNSIAACTRQ
jgi:hypothetical protein